MDWFWNMSLILQALIVLECFGTLTGVLILLRTLVRELRKHWYDAQNETDERLEEFFDRFFEEWPVFVLIILSPIFWPLIVLSALGYITK